MLIWATTRVLDWDVAQMRCWSSCCPTFIAGWRNNPRRRISSFASRTDYLNELTETCTFLARNTLSYHVNAFFIHWERLLARFISEARLGNDCSININKLLVQKVVLANLKVVESNISSKKLKSIQDFLFFHRRINSRRRQLFLKYLLRVALYQGTNRADLPGRGLEGVDGQQDIGVL